MTGRRPPQVQNIKKHPECIRRRSKSSDVGAFAGPRAICNARKRFLLTQRPDYWSSSSRADVRKGKQTLGGPLQIRAHSRTYRHSNHRISGRLLVLFPLGAYGETKHHQRERRLGFVALALTKLLAPRRRPLAATNCPPGKTSRGHPMGSRLPGSLVAAKARVHVGLCYASLRELNQTVSLTLTPTAR